MAQKHYPADGKKRCYNCEQWKEATLQYFGRNKKASDGLNWICKACQKEKRDARRDENKTYFKGYYQTHKEEHRERTRRYRHEHREQINARAAEWKRNKRRERGAPIRVRIVLTDEERRERKRLGDRRYRQENLDRIRESQRNHYHENRDVIREKNRIRYRENGEKARAYSRQRARKNPEANRNRVRRWQDANKERVREQRGVVQARRRTRKSGLSASFTVREWQYCLDYWHHACAVCGRPVGLWHTLAKDHWIPLSYEGDDNPGFVAWNVVPLCHGIGGCNNEKSDRMPQEWLVLKLGKAKARKKMAEISQYFQHVQAAHAATARPSATANGSATSAEEQAA